MPKKRFKLERLLNDDGEKPRKITAYPELIEHTGEWMISEIPEADAPGVACSSRNQRVMAIPTDDTDRARAVRIHELAHVRWSPREIDLDVLKASHASLLAAEDKRINTLLWNENVLGWQENTWDQETERYENLPSSLQFDDVDQPNAAHLVSRGAWRGLASMLLATENTGRHAVHQSALYGFYRKAHAALVQAEEGTPDEAAKKAEFERVDMIYRVVTHTVNTCSELITSDPWSFRNTVLAARLLDKLDDPKTFGKPAPGEGEGGKGDAIDELVEKGLEHMRNRRPGDRAKSEIEKLLEELRKELAEEIPEGELPGDEKPEPTPPAEEPTTAEGDITDKAYEQGTKSGKSGYKDDMPEGSDVQWGNVEWVKVPLRRRLPKHMLGKGNRAAEEGVIPVKIHRALSDGKVFVRKAKAVGGSVLIDQSGSMNLTAEDVEQIIMAAPAVSIAAYAGKSGGEGEMRVLAEKGRMAVGDDLYIPWSGNVIDYPALEWLSRQPEPRIWVSDGHVIAVHGNRIDQIEMCVRICKRKRIVRVEKPENARDLLRMLKHVGG